MAEAVAPYIASCPVGCDAALVPTTIVLPEGALRCCEACGQLVSSIGEEAYRRSMQRFDEAGFNLPAPRELERRFRLARRRLDTISALLGRTPAAIRVLDVGCSRGAFLAAGTRLGFHMEGVEPAASIAAAARKEGHKVYAGELANAGLAEGSFDAVTLFEIIEHLKDPLALLRACHRVLKPDGVLVLSTGNAASWTAVAMRERWDYFHIAQDAGHVSFFNPRSLELLAGRAGFRPERLDTARVRLFERGDVARWRYLAGKLCAEILDLPARIAGRGHDMLAYWHRA